MEKKPRSVSWEAPEHHHIEKGNDWFFALIVIVVCLVLVAILLNDVLFALLLGIAGGVLLMVASNKPAIIPYEISVKGVKVGGEFYPYNNLLSYYIDEEDPHGPHILIKIDSKIMPLLVFPIPEEHIYEIEEILQDRLPEEYLEESIFVKIFEVLGV